MYKLEMESITPFGSWTVKIRTTVRQPMDAFNESPITGCLSDIKLFRHGLCIENQVLSERIVLPG